MEVLFKLRGVIFYWSTISESQRIHVPFLVKNKLCTADYTFPDQSLSIKAGTTIAVSVHSMHRDPKFYPDPEQFIPERFTDDEVAKRHKFVYLPFGEGPRMCLGELILAGTNKANFHALPCYALLTYIKTSCGREL